MCHWGWHCWKHRIGAMIHLGRNCWILLTGISGHTSKRTKFHVHSPLLLKKWHPVCIDWCNWLLSLFMFFWCRPVSLPTITTHFLPGWGSEEIGRNPIYSERVQWEGCDGMAHPLLGWCSNLPSPLPWPANEYHICRNETWRMIVPCM